VFLAKNKIYRKRVRSWLDTFDAPSNDRGLVTFLDLTHTWRRPDASDKKNIHAYYEVIKNLRML